MDKEAFDYVMLRQLKLAAEDDKPSKKDEDKDDKDKPEPKNKKKTSPPPANDIVGTNTYKGLAADILSPGNFGADRAGRAQSMATAAGYKTPFRVQHPNTSRLMSAVGGGLLGGAGGGLLGAGLGRLVSGKQDMYGARLGAGLGAGWGALLGAIHDGGRRNEQIRQIGGAYDKSRDVGSIQPVVPQFSELSTLVSPLGGQHRRGQLSGYYAMTGNPALEKTDALSKATYAASVASPLAELISPGLSFPIQLGVAGGHSRAAKMESDALQKKLSVDWEPLKAMGKQISGGVATAGKAVYDAAKPVATQMYNALPEGRARQSLIGAGIGAGVGLLGGGAAGLMSRPDEGESRIGNMFSGAGTGAIGGGAVGAGVGALTPEWSPHVMPYVEDAKKEYMLDELEGVIGGRLPKVTDRIRNFLSSRGGDNAPADMSLQGMTNPPVDVPSIGN